LAELAAGRHWVNLLATDGTDSFRRVHVEGSVETLGAEEVAWQQKRKR
jgi:hypothetical protein